MATVAAKTSKIYLNGYDFSPNVKAYELSISCGTAEDSALGDAFRSRIHTVNDGEGSFEGYYDVAAGGTDAVLGPIIGTGNDVLTYLPGGDTDQLFGYAMQADMSGYTPLTGTFDDIVAASANFSGDGGWHRIQIHHALGAESSTGTTTAIDFGAQSTAGGSAYIHLTAHGGSYGAFDIDVEDSADNSTFATLASFTQITADNAKERILFTGNVERYIRLSYTLTTITSATFFVGVARFT